MESKIMEHLSSENELKLLDAVEILDKIVLIGNDVLIKIPTADFQNYTFILINFLQRFNGAFQSISILLNRYKNNPNIETSIGLIIRASLLDCIVLSYIGTYADDLQSDNITNKHKFEEIINEFMSDQLNYVLKHLRLLKKCNQISSYEFQEELNLAYSNFKYLFNLDIIDEANPIENLICKQVKSITHYYTRISSHSLTKDCSKNLYNLYIYYSKYDHFGSMTHFLQSHNIEYNFTRILIALQHLIFGFKSSLNSLQLPNNDSIIKEKKTLEMLEMDFNNIVNWLYTSINDWL